MQKQIYNIALPYLEDKLVKDVRIGLELLGVKLSDGTIGVSYVLKEPKKGCLVLPEAGKIKGMSAKDMAAWFYKDSNLVKRSLGLAVLNAVSCYQELDYTNEDGALAVNLDKEDIVGMVGYMKPIVRTVKEKGCRLVAFDYNLSKDSNLYPVEEQPARLPECNVVFISGTTLINNTLEEILAYCSSAREISIVGASTPLYPQVFRKTNVTRLSGIKWISKNSSIILEIISQAAGLRHIIRFGEKISLCV